MSDAKPSKEETKILSINKMIKMKSKTIKKLNPLDIKISPDSKMPSIAVNSDLDKDESEGEDEESSDEFDSDSKIHDSSEVSVEQVHIRLRDKNRMKMKGNLISGITDQDLINFMEPEERKSLYY